MSTQSALGRPRDHSRDIAIESAAIELLREVGYEKITMESVALRAKVSKTTIYRRWKNKAALMADSVHHYAFAKSPLIDTGSLRKDLIESILGKVKTLKSSDGQLIAGLLTAARGDNELAQMLTHFMSEGANFAYSPILDRALARGEISQHAQREIILELVPAVISFRIFMTNQSVNRKFIEHFVDDILIPSLNPAI